MSLSCSCSDDYDWWYIAPSDYSKLSTKRSRKCCSCGARVRVGDLCAEFECWRYPEHEVELRIYGDGGEVAQPTKYMCEQCADLYYSLEELGFCINLGDNMRALVAEYAELHKRRPQA